MKLAGPRGWLEDRFRYFGMSHHLNVYIARIRGHTGPFPLDVLPWSRGESTSVIGHVRFTKTT